MSEMQAAAGKYRPIYTDMELEEACKEACSKENILNKMKEYGYESYEECLMEWFYEAYMVFNNKLYELAESKDIDAYGFSEVEEMENGDIKYFCLWYNGGASLGEVIEDGLKK